ncbi:15-hydroxyprostaglandin dehydrogenase [Trichonephila clavipes]|nr:15-hydroxyprostaglandin dehydrogenase [Trichonephila clavipes]
MASDVLADPTRALQGTNRGSSLAMEESENDIGSLEQLLLYADEHYLARKLPLGDHLGKVLHGVEEYPQQLPKQLRRKLDIRAKLGIMLGYALSTKGYRIWLIEENKVVETMNIRFDEGKRGVDSERHLRDQREII